MSLDIFVLCGAVAGSLVLLLPIKEMKSSAFPIALASLSVLVTLNALKGASPLVNYFNTFMDSELSFYFKILTKVLGITLICNITSDMACDLGMNALSGKVELAGKIAVLLTAVPLFDTLLTRVEQLV